MRNKPISSLIGLAICFFAYGCHHENKLQRDLALKVADYIKSDLANINYSYNYRIICNNSIEGIASPEHPKKPSQAVPEIVKASIRNHTKTDCTANPAEFSSFLNLLEDHLNQYQGDIVLIIQFPWKTIEDKQIESLANQFDNLDKKEKIKKILIFGLHGESPKMMKIFRALPAITNSEGIDKESVQLAIKNLSSDITKNHTSKPYTVLTLFIPVEDR